MPQKTANPATPPSARRSQPTAERDLLKAIDRLFLHDQLQALLASPALSQSSSGSDAGASPGDVRRGGAQPSLDTESLGATLGSKRE